MMDVGQRMLMFIVTTVDVVRAAVLDSIFRTIPIWGLGLEAYCRGALCELSMTQSVAVPKLLHQ